MYDRITRVRIDNKPRGRRKKAGKSEEKMDRLYFSRDNLNTLSKYILNTPVKNK